MKSYVVVGLGGRSLMYTKALTEEYADSTKLLAICDSNPGRIKLRADILKPKCATVKSYQAHDFDKMIKEQKPDCVIVCTMDSTHDDYICRALEAGCDVITEKPMTIDEKRCQRIIDAVQKTGKNVRVTFNYRYSPPRTQVKELLMDGVIGKVLSVDFQWLLDTNHGADYYRRWHRNKANSGGLLVHKATHHFDLINWWLGSIPDTVFAQGSKSFYTPAQAKRYGLEERGERCLDCPVSDKCNFYLDMSALPFMKQTYQDNESYDGYFRDRCVFSEDIDIEDTMNLIVKYKSGAFLSYCLSTFTGWEGYHVAFNGTKGRLEHSCQESSYVNGDGSVQGGLKMNGTKIKVSPHFQTPYDVEIRKATGSHGGGDVVMCDDIFGTPTPDPLLRAADYVQGVYSIIVGIAGNKSIATDQIITIDDLVKNLPDPGYPQNKTNDQHIPYVPDAQCFDAKGKVVQANVPKQHLVHVEKT